MSQALHLHRLQLVDSQVDQLRNRLKTIQKTLAEDTAVRNARSAYEKAVQYLDQAQLNLKHLEDAVEKQNIHIQQEEASLYGGLVKNPKELKDLQDELAALRRRLSVLEDQELETMVVVDEKQNLVKQAASLLQDAEDQYNHIHTDLLTERVQIEKTVERLQSERQAIHATIPVENLRTYDRLRTQRGGNAVVEVIDKSCSACGATLTPAEWQIARSPDKLSFCPSCGRILYAG